MPERASNSPTPHDNRHRSLTGLSFPIFAGALIGLIGLWFTVGETATDFEAFALQEGTGGYMATWRDDPVHCMDLTDAAGCLQAALKRDADKRAVWLGNSQLHAINQMAPGQVNAPQHLFERLHREHIDLLTFSQPNADLQEHYILFEYIQSQQPVDLLILPLVFDDLRESGVRDGVSRAIRHEAVSRSLRQSEIGRKLIERIGQTDTDSDMAALDQTVQERVEVALNQWLEKYVPLWAGRPEARGKVLTNLYILRNTLFGINPGSKRPLIPGAYTSNMEALEALLASAARSGTRVLLYIPPLRDDAEVPYVAEEYDRFKKEAAGLALAHQAKLVNLEHLVPGRLWGSKDATNLSGEPELDFMHFKAEGHTLLAGSVYQALNGLQIGKGGSG
ncbi:MAG: hypothetical protein ACE5FN_00310 [Leptospirillia bacterium]